MNKNGKLKVGLNFFCLVLYIAITLNSSMAQDLNPGSWPHLKGYWKFQSASQLTKATVGKDLVLTGTHKFVTGPADGDTAIRIGVGSYYTCAHDMAPNGGGDSVNQYTLMFDFKVLSFKKWHTFFKTDSNNNNDGECFIRPITGSSPGRIGVGATGYSKDSINPNQWYRLMISVNLNHYYRYYINGQLFHEGDTQELDGRFALTPKMIFFGDDNQEDDTIDVASVAVFDTCLSAADIAKIGTIEPCIANPPKADLGNDTTLCAYESVVKYANPGYVKYQWSTGSKFGFANLTSKNPGLGKRIVWLKVTDVNGCTAADTMIVTFNVAPKINELGPSQYFCKGDTFATLIAGTDTSYKYEWRKYGSGGNKVFYTGRIYITDSSGNYIGTVINSFGCRNSDTVQINAFTKPGKPTIIANSPGLKFCKGQSVALMGPHFASAYLWSNGVKQQTVFIDKTSSLTLMISDGNCYSLPSDTVFVTVDPLPPKPKLNISGNKGICQGDSVVLAVAVGYKAYTWNDGVMDNNRSVKTAGKFFVMVTDSNNCISIASDTLTAVVYSVPAQPVLNIQGRVEICEGESVVLSTLSTYQNYDWSDNTTTKQDTVDVSGTYRVRVGNTSGCNSEWSDSTVVVVRAVPSKPAVIKVGMDSLRSDKSAVNYEWYHNGVLLPDNAIMIASAPSGYYQVRIKNDWCWSVWSDSFLYANSRINGVLNAKNQLLVYPNPFKEELTVNLKEPFSAKDAMIIIADLLGREIYQYRLSGIQQSDVLKINLSHLAAGNYVLKIITDSEALTAKIEKIN